MVIAPAYWKTIKEKVEKCCRKRKLLICYPQIKIRTSKKYFFHWYILCSVDKSIKNICKLHLFTFSSKICLPFLRRMQNALSDGVVENKKSFKRGISPVTHAHKEKNIRLEVISSLTSCCLRSLINYLQRPTTTYNELQRPKTRLFIYLFISNCKVWRDIID